VKTITYPKSATYTADGTMYTVSTQLYQIGVYLVITQGSKTLAQHGMTPKQAKEFFDSLSDAKDVGQLTELYIGESITVQDVGGLWEEFKEQLVVDSTFITDIILSGNKVENFSRKAKQAFKYYGFQFYVHLNYSGDYYTVSEYTRGIAVIEKNINTPERAIKAARKEILFHGKDKVTKAIEKHPILND